MNDEEPDSKKAKNEQKGVIKTSEDNSKRTRNPDDDIEPTEDETVTSE